MKTWNTFSAGNSLGGIPVTWGTRCQSCTIKPTRKIFCRATRLFVTHWQFLMICECLRSRLLMKICLPEEAKCFSKRPNLAVDIHSFQPSIKNSLSRDKRESSCYVIIRIEYHDSRRCHVRSQVAAKKAPK